MTAYNNCPSLGHPKLRSIHDYVTHEAQAPQSLTLVGLLCASSFLIQGLTDVRLPTGDTEPTSLFGFIIAPSGEGKSAVANRLMRPINAFLEEHEGHSGGNGGTNSVEDQVWAKTRERLIARIADLKATTEYDNISEDERTHKLESLRQHLHEHENQKTDQSQILGLKTFGQISSAALREAIRQEGIRSAALVTAEGQEVTKSGLQNQLALLNSAWAGEPVMRARASDSADWLDFRLTLYVQLQPQPAHEFFFRKSAEARDIGLAARALICTPPSVRGQRRFESTDAVAEDAAATYEARARELLQRNVEQFRDGTKPRAVLAFSEEAQTRWRAMAQEIEQESSGAGRIAEFPDHGPKLASNISRIAAVLHAFEYDLDGEISAKTLEHAISIGWHFSEAFTNYFRTPSEQEADLPAIRELIQRKRSEGHRFLPKKLITDARPVPTVTRIEVALHELEAEGTIKTFEVPRLTASGRKGSPAVLVDLCPDLPHDQWQMDQALKLV